MAEKRKIAESYVESWLEVLPRVANAGFLCGWDLGPIYGRFP